MNMGERSIKTNINIPLDLLEKVEAVAKKYRTTRTSIITLALQRYILQLEEEYNRLLETIKEDE